MMAVSLKMCLAEKEEKKAKWKHKEHIQMSGRIRLRSSRKIKQLMKEQWWMTYVRPYAQPKPVQIRPNKHVLEVIVPEESL